MITISEINKKHEFPLIDFKFHNSGNMTAILWEFNIIVNNIEIDLTPTFEFTYEVNGSSLEIYALNNGFGSAHNCEICISHPILNSIFSDSLYFIGNIESGENKKVITLIGNTSTSEIIHNILFNDSDKLNLHSITDNLKGEIINNIEVNWNCLTSKGEKLQKSGQVRGKEGVLYLLKSGFFYYPTHYCYCLMPPTEVYCVIIDVDKGEQNLSYPISRKILTGDVDRFHIMVGANKSAIINLDFSFKIDSNTIVKSNIFNIEIWKPLNSRFANKYIDATILETKLEKLNKSSFEDKYEIEYLERKLNELREKSTYPFYYKNEQDFDMF